MVGRSKRKINRPVANQLSGAAEPNVLSTGDKPGKSGKTGKPAWDWTAEGAVIGTEPDDDFELEEELDADFDDEAVDEELDDRTPEQRQADLEAELQRQAEEFGLTSDDPKALYGPNGEDVAAVLDTLDELDTESAERLAEAWELVDPAEREVVERILGRRHRGGEHEYELSAAEEAVAAWLAARAPADDDEEELWQEVAQAAMDAITAIILDEDLSDADYDTLYGPWDSAMETEDDSTPGATSHTAVPVAGESAPNGGDDAAGAREAEVDPETRAKDEEEYGPNAETVIAFLARLDELTTTEAERLALAWEASDKDALQFAHASLEEALADDRNSRRQVKRAQDRIVEWVQGQIGISRASRTVAGQTVASKAAGRLRQRVAPTLADAVAALAIADLLPPEDAGTLYAPWAEIVGEPPLPEFEDEGSS
jgi:hypothetical protein